MTAIIMIGFVLIFIAAYRLTGRFVNSALDSFVLFAALTVLSCELLSIFHSYNTKTVFAYWVCVGVMLVVFICKRVCPVANVNAIERLRHLRFSVFDMIVIGIFLLFLTITFFLCIAYPPVNYDSVVYHMPRVFFWMKNEAIWNYPTDSARQLYSGPLSEFFILQLQTLNHGKDFMANLVQWSFYFGSIIGVYGISKEIGCSRHSSFVSAVLAATVPLAVLQATTTQNDLSVAFWCIVAVYYIVNIMKRYHHGEAVSCLRIMLLGFSAGAAALTKSSAYIVLLPFAVLLFVYLARKLPVKQIFIFIGIALLCMLLLNLGFYIRNAIELGGNFLAYGFPESKQLIPKTNALPERFVLLLKNIAYCLGSTNVGANQMLEHFVYRVSDFLNIDINDIAITEYGQGYSVAQPNLWSHDVASYPFHLVAGGVCALLAAYGGLNKKSRWKIMDGGGYLHLA
jgi:hypothetical protein